MINCMNDLTKGGWGMKRKKLPVVFLSLKGVDGLTFDLAYQALCGIIVEEFSRLRFWPPAISWLLTRSSILRRF